MRKWGMIMDQMPRSVFFWSVLLLIVAVVSLGTFYFDSSRSTLENQYLQSFETSVVQLDDSVYDFLMTFENAVQMFSQNDMVKDLSENAEVNLDKVEQMFQAFQQSYPYSAYAYYVFKNPLEDGRFMVTWPDTSETLKSSDYDPKSRPWYIGALDMNGFSTWSDPYEDATTQKPTITISRAVYNDTGRLEGVMAVDVFLDELSNKVENFKALHSGNAYIISGEKGKYNILAHNDSASVYPDILNQSWVEKLDDSASGTFEVEMAGVDYYLTYTTNDVTGWKTVGLVEKKEIYVQSMQVLRNVLLSTVLILSLGILSIVYISRQLTYSVKDIDHFIQYSGEKSGQLATSELTKKFESISGTFTDSDIVLKRTSLNILFDVELEIARVSEVLKSAHGRSLSEDENLKVEDSKSRLYALKDELLENPSERHHIQVEEIQSLFRAIDEKQKIKV